VLPIACQQATGLTIWQALVQKWFHKANAPKSMRQLHLVVTNFAD
jgi:hypothetical protein